MAPEEQSGGLGWVCFVVPPPARIFSLGPLGSQRVEATGAVQWLEGSFLVFIANFLNFLVMKTLMMIKRQSPKCKLIISSVS